MARPFLKVVVPFYTPANNIGDVQLLYILPNIRCCRFTFSWYDVVATVSPAEVVCMLPFSPITTFALVSQEKCWTASLPFPSPQALLVGSVPDGGWAVVLNDGQSPVARYFQTTLSLYWMASAFARAGRLEPASCFFVDLPSPPWTSLVAQR